ncbi:Elongation factor Ts, mitochondrial [Plasmodiophora brassicae]|uniref:Elongation factor Ts, mitochondrial n=1 Tax=Plasmodiophora brassicae TaxID=37360 RepID=A0A0G4ILW5_PLABS|nr:hypothetical protein PBRA_004863 [Plasmodiophora brassicae]SPQ93281.1 unnamed protein product [Plasmodiophora brassicae]
MMMWCRRALSTSAVPVDLVRSLRAKTGAPIVDCQKALLEAKLDMDGAMRHLRTTGLARASKYEMRPTNQGVIALASGPEGAVLIELQSETDFVAQNEIFLKLAQSAAASALKQCTTSGDWAKPDVDAIKSGTEEAFTDALVALRENIVLSRAVGIPVPPGSLLASYVHNKKMPGVGQIGVIAALSGDKAAEIGDKIAMHIAATSPTCIDAKDMPSAMVDAERTILLEQARLAIPDKPQKILDSIVNGRLQKWISERVLLDQVFALGDAQRTIRAILSDHNATVNAFARLRIGEQRC